MNDSGVKGASVFAIYVVSVAILTVAYCLFLVWAMQADDRAADEPALMRALFRLTDRMFRPSPPATANPVEANAWGQS